MTNQNQKDRIRAYMARHAVNYTTARRAVLNAAHENSDQAIASSDSQAMTETLTRPAAALLAEALPGKAPAPSGTRVLAPSSARDINRWGGFTTALGARDLTIVATLHAVFWAGLVLGLASDRSRVDASTVIFDTSTHALEVVV